MYRLCDATVFGVQFSNNEGVLLSTSFHFSDVYFRQSTKVYGFQTIHLDKNERLVGIVSGQRGYDEGRHHDLSFVI